MKPARIFLVAGEPSGDLLGGRLMAALKKQRDVSFSGVGGAHMEAEGLKPLFPMSDLALFGLAEILPKIPLILRRMKETEAAIRSEMPDVVITIDAPDFNFRLAKRLKGSGIPVIHYVAPTVWAWRPGRAKKIQPLFNHLLALFPFEPPYFEKVGLPCSFVGHPLAEAGIADVPPMDMPSPSLIVLPGSRRSELHYLLPVFRETVAQLAQKHPQLSVAIPTVPHLHDAVAAAVKDWPVPVRLLTNVREKYACMRGATAALAASGTVALELALAGCPAVIAYKIHPITATLYRPLIKTPYASLVNIMAGNGVVPEFLQENCQPPLIAAAVDELIVSAQARGQQKEFLHRVGAWLRPHNGMSPSVFAAEIVSKSIP